MLGIQVIGIQVKLGIPDGNRAGSNFEIFGHDNVINRGVFL